MSPRLLRMKGERFETSRHAMRDPIAPGRWRVGGGEEAAVEGRRVTFAVVGLEIDERYRREREMAER